MLDLSAEALQRLGNPASCLLHFLYLKIPKPAILPAIVKLLPFGHGAPHLFQQFHILHHASQHLLGLYSCNMACRRALSAACLRLNISRGSFNQFACWQCRTKLVGCNSTANVENGKCTFSFWESSL